MVNFAPSEGVFIFIFQMFGYPHVDIAHVAVYNA